MFFGKLFANETIQHPGSAHKLDPRCVSVGSRDLDDVTVANPVESSPVTDDHLVFLADAHLIQLENIAAVKVLEFEVEIRHGG